MERDSGSRCAVPPRAVGSTRRQDFSYDGLNRLTGSTGLASGDRSYTYDLDGNRLTRVEGSTTYTAGYDRTGAITTVGTSGQGAPLQAVYDAFGNLLANPESGLSTPTFAYDAANRLTAIDGPGTANDTTFGIDALGRHVSRTIGTTTETYEFAGLTETVTRIDAATPIESLVDDTGARLATRSGGTVSWLLPDPHGNVAGQAVGSTLASALRYDGYGVTVATYPSSLPDAAARWKYQGRLDVSPTGLDAPLYDFRARFYSPGLGTFTQLDTLQGSALDPLSLTRYLYAQANPATLIDPTGHLAHGPCGPDGMACDGVGYNPTDKPGYQNPDSPAKGGASSGSGSGQSNGNPETTSSGTPPAGGAEPPFNPTPGDQSSWWLDRNHLFAFGLDGLPFVYDMETGTACTVDVNGKEWCMPGAIAALYWNPDLGSYQTDLSLDSVNGGEADDVVAFALLATALFAPAVIAGSAVAAELSATLSLASGPAEVGTACLASGLCQRMQAWLQNLNGALLGEGAPPNPTALLQSATDDIIRTFDRRPGAWYGYLTQAEQRSLTEDPSAWGPALFGSAVERALARRIGSDDALKAGFEHWGGRNRPDFGGLGVYSGHMFELTTPAAISEHATRWYGWMSEYVTYQRPDDYLFFLFGG